MVQEDPERSFYNYIYTMFYAHISDQPHTALIALTR